MTKLEMPELPEGYVMKVRFDIDGDLKLIVYEAEGEVASMYSTAQSVQWDAEALAEKIRNGFPYLT